MRARPLLVLAVAAAAACGRGAPWEGGPSCPHDLDSDRTPNVEVVLSSFTTVVRHDLSLDAVAHLPGIETLGPGGKLQGLTVIHHRLDYKTGIALSHRLFRSGACAWVDKLTVDITPEKAEIYVPSEYPESSCEYQQILAHERLHDDTHREELAAAADALRRALAKADWLPARGTPLTVADRAEAERRIEADVDAVAKPVYDGFERELKERNAVIDLPENYRWTASRCTDWK